MDLDEAITITRIELQNQKCYLMIGWQSNSFEMYLYTKNSLWKGRLSPNRLTGFSRNLHMTDEEYVKSLRRCLSQERENYRYELKSGFFYWKRKLQDSVVMEGFLPVEIITTPQTTQPDLVEVLLSLNRHLKEKVNGLLYKYKTVKSDYQKCLKDTEDFLNLKVDMEKSLCTKFLKLLSMKKAKLAETENYELEEINEDRTISQNDLNVIGDK